MDVVVPPALAATQTLDNVSNLDVRSALVLDFNQNILFNSTGTYHIHVYDDSGVTGLITTNALSTTGTTSVQDTTKNDVDITITNGIVTGLMVGTVDYTLLGGGVYGVMTSTRMAQSAIISGSKLIIDVGGGDVSTNAFNFDWDFGANYHVEFDAGLVTSADGSQTNAALSSTTAVNFTTVTPAADAIGAASQIQSTTDGSLSASYLWHSAHQGSGTSQAGAVALNFTTGMHALVAEAGAVAGTLPANTKYTAVPLSGNVNITGFGSNDILYTDNNGNMSLVTTQGTLGATLSGAASTTSAANSTIKRTDGGNRVNEWFADYGTTGGQSAGYGVGSGASGLAGTGDVYLEGVNAFNKDLIMFG
jgi:hypothetical protein